jgi:Putative Flp pilus-assembly TadE/G-like
MKTRIRNARGSVLVLVAVAIFPIAGMMTFAIDASHWFDYSRNLQNRADAAALAGGLAFGNTCFLDSYGDPWTGLQSKVGKWAQLYSGPGTGEPFDGGSNPAANVPYSDATVAAATGVNPFAYKNVPNLTLGSLNDYFVRLNADDYADKGGTNFAMSTTDPSANGGVNQGFCNSDPHLDKTDKDPGDPGGMVDVKVTQEQLPNFIPIFNVHPNIEAHARVELQQLQVAENVRPIAVGDASDIPCITANFLNADGNLVTSEKLVQEKDANGDPTGTWNSTADAKAVTMPTGASPVTVELFLNNCVTGNAAGTKYDYITTNGQGHQLGLVYINNWGNPASPVTAPQVAAGGVTLTGSNASICDPYFQSSGGACAVGVTANVVFPAPASGVTYYVRAVDAGSNNSCDPNSNSCSNVDLNVVSGTSYSSATGFPAFGSDSGKHNIDIWTAQLGGSVGGKSCNTSSGTQWATSNKNCWTDLGIQQRAFSGINGTNLCNDPTFDTGPLQWITVGQEDNNGNIVANTGANAFAQGASPRLFIRTSVAGLSNSQFGDPSICLRVGESTSHDTGLIICPPQTSGGGQQDIAAIENGCDPLQKNIRVQQDGSLLCSPTIVPNDCVTNDTGQSPPVLKGFDNLVCTDGNNPVNNWQLNQGNVDITDPRALVFVITAPVDFTTQNGTTQNPTIPIRNFAVFYITGWSTGQGGVQGCSNNESAPAGAGNGEIWGHWTSLPIPGSGNGEQCKFNEFGNCVAALTR